MYVNMLGLATTHRRYNDKETGAEVLLQNVVVDDQAFAVKVPSGVAVRKLEPVVVSGDLGFWNRQVVLRRGMVRLATAADVELLSDPQTDEED